MEKHIVPGSELHARTEKFIAAMDKAYADWEVCAIVGSVSMYYFTGTICDGVLMIKRGGAPVLWVRRSYERAILESKLGDIRQMRSFRDIADCMCIDADTLYLDMSEATLDWYVRFNKYMGFSRTLPIDKIILGVRAVKSKFELEAMERAGSEIDRLYLTEVPGMMRKGMSEAELGAEIFALLIANGSHGVCRFSLKGDTLLGQVGFGESPLYPSTFNGASGTPGLAPAAPVLGSRDVKLEDGCLVYIDVAFGIDGYHVDKTIVYSYKQPQPNHVADAHRHCLELQALAASMLRPGVKPSAIYAAVMSALNPEYRDCFMGAPGRTVPFVGHSVGLYVDELPVLAKGFDEPLECGMTIAVEPKIGIAGHGMVGSENTYLVTESGGFSLTGKARDIIEVLN